MSKHKTLILKKSKWTCGSPLTNQNPENCLGSGLVKLLNIYGEMCCLGQFCLQIDTTLTEEDIKNKMMPSGLKKDIPLFTTENHNNTLLSKNLAKINDDVNTTVDEKITDIRKELKKAKIQLKVVD